MQVSTISFQMSCISSIQGDGIPDLEYVAFHLEVSSLLCRFVVARYCGKLQADRSHSTLLASATRRAAEVLQEAIAGKEVCLCEWCGILILSGVSMSERI